MMRFAAQTSPAARADAAVSLRRAVRSCCCRRRCCHRSATLPAVVSVVGWGQLSAIACISVLSFGQGPSRLTHNCQHHFILHTHRLLCFAPNSNRARCRCCPIQAPAVAESPSPRPLHRDTGALPSTTLPRL
ncbi:hypothetical protein BU16DRAFT_595534, partial [Lophium mytilinum]